MVEPNENDKSLDLESSVLDELERMLVCETDTDDNVADFESLAEGPRTSRQSEPLKRELLHNSFDSTE